MSYNMLITCKRFGVRKIKPRLIVPWYLFYTESGIIHVHNAIHRTYLKCLIRIAVTTYINTYLILPLIVRNNIRNVIHGVTLKMSNSAIKRYIDSYTLWWRRGVATTSKTEDEAFNWCIPSSTSFGTVSSSQNPGMLKATVKSWMHKM